MKSLSWWRTREIWMLERLDGGERIFVFRGNLLYLSWWFFEDEIEMVGVEVLIKIRCRLNVVQSSWGFSYFAEALREWKSKKDWKFWFWLQRGFVTSPSVWFLQSFELMNSPKFKISFISVESNTARLSVSDDFMRQKNETRWFPIRNFHQLSRTTWTSSSNFNASELKSNTLQVNHCNLPSTIITKTSNFTSTESYY
jgi:hypothetical protein